MSLFTLELANLPGNASKAKKQLLADSRSALQVLAEATKQGILTDTADGQDGTEQMLRVHTGMADSLGKMEIALVAAGSLQDASQAKMEKAIGSTGASQASMAASLGKMEIALEKSSTALEAYQTNTASWAQTASDLLNNGLVIDRKTGRITMFEDDKKSDDKSDDKSDSITDKDLAKALKDAGHKALATEIEYQGKLIHWNILRHKRTQYLAVGIAIGVIATAYGPRVVAMIRGTDAGVDADMEDGGLELHAVEG